MTALLWVALPYTSITIFILGTLYRRRYDKLGWTTRSSQLYEHTVLRWGSPMFHIGFLLVLGGHATGLLVPAAWTEAAGINETTYHAAAVGLGAAAGFLTLAGLTILITRRRLVGPVFTSTTRNDKTMYLLLTIAILLGLWTTIRVNATGGGYDYRETVSPWFRSLFILQPEPDQMRGVPLALQLHITAAWTLIAAWPFTRLVHAFSGIAIIPKYLTRPYIVYRSRDPHPAPSRVGAWKDAM